MSQADGHLASARWRVDGVLMQNEITSMAFTQPHVLKLVVRDARGTSPGEMLAFGLRRRARQGEG